MDGITSCPLDGRIEVMKERETSAPRETTEGGLRQSERYKGAT